MLSKTNSGSPLADPSLPKFVARLSEHAQRDNSDLLPPGQNIGHLYLWEDTDCEPWWLNILCCFAFGAVMFAVIAAFLGAFQ